MNSSRMGWPVPSKDKDPWYEEMLATVAAQDADAYAAREDRSLFLIKGGTFTWTLSSSNLSWDATIELISPIAGRHLDVAAGNVTLQDGQFLYIGVTRNPLSNLSTSLTVAGSIPNTADVMAVAVRRGNLVYFRNGFIIQDGSPAEVFNSTPGPATIAVKDQQTDYNVPGSDVQWLQMIMKPDGSSVYTANANLDKPVWHFSTSTNKWEITPTGATIPVLSVCHWVFNPAGTKLYILDFDNNVYIVNPSTNLITGTVANLPTAPSGGGGFRGMGINPGGTELWIADYSTNQIHVVNPATDTYTTSFSPGATGAHVVFEPSGAKAYVLYDSGVYVVDAVAHTLIADLSDGNQCYDLVALPDGSEVWVTVFGGGPDRVRRISVSGDAYTGSDINLSTTPANATHETMAVKSDSSKVYVLVSNGNVDEITVASHTLTATLTFSSFDGRGALAINPVNSRLYVSSMADTPPRVKVVNLSNNSTIDTIDYTDVPAQPGATTVGSFNALRFVGINVINDGGGQVGLEFPVEYDRGSVADNNIKANRSGTDASTVDQAVKGATNFGSGSSVDQNYGTVGGGQSNTTNGVHATVVGGYNNKATGLGATVGGGRNNTASGQDSFVAGNGSSSASTSAVAIGQGASVDNKSNRSVALGLAAVETATDGVAIGSAYANKANAVSIGTSAAQGTDSAAISTSTVTEASTGAAAIAGGSTADGQFSVGIADGQATGTKAIAMAGSTAGANFATALAGSSATGVGATAIGEADAEGKYSTAFGSGAAVADGSFALGPEAKAIRKGQFTFANGRFSSDSAGSGFTKTSFMVMRGETITGVGVETCDLTTGELADQELTIFANTHYFITVSAVAAGNISGGSSVTDSIETFYQTYAVKHEGGTPTLISGTLNRIDDSANANGNPSGWTLTASIQSSPDRVRFRFSTNTAPAVTRIVAKVEFTELLFV